MKLGSGIAAGDLKIVIRDCLWSGGFEFGLKFGISNFKSENDNPAL
jgi:hypothetical protein